jgi:transposase
LAYKAEHVVDLQSDMILAAEIYPADHADTQTLVDSVLAAVENVQQAGSQTEIAEIVADKGYHAAETIELAQDLNFRTYIPERKRPHRSRWTDKPAEFRQAVYANRRRLKCTKSRRFQKLRSERVERTFAHVCDTGGMRRSWLKEVVNVSKRYLIAAAAHNLGRIMRKLFGVGKPRTLQDRGRLIALAQLVTTLLRDLLLTSRLSNRVTRSDLSAAAA